MSDNEDSDQGEDYDWSDEGESDKDSDTDEIYTDKTVYKPERNAKERVGLPGFMVVEKPKTRLEHAMMDPLDRFRLYVDGISRSLNNWDNVNITQADIDQMLITAAELDVVEYKNPSAYILGYLVTNGGKTIDKKKFQYCYKECITTFRTSGLCVTTRCD